VRSRHRLRLRAAITIERRPDAGEGEQRPVIVEREPDDILFPGLRVRLRRVLGEAVRRGIKQRFSGLSQPRQCGDEVLRMFVTGIHRLEAVAACPSASWPFHAKLAVKFSPLACNAFSTPMRARISSRFGRAFLR